MSTTRLPARRLRLIYRKLLDRYGPQDWWPGDTPFEIMVGAVLTQNTAWTNVEKAIANLKRQRLLSARKIVQSEHAALAELLRPSGYFNIKARRLKNFCQWYLEQGEYRALKRRPTPTLRQQVLGVNGVGPETADDILLYAFDRPVFVIDAYTRRLLVRLKMIEGKEPYEGLRQGIERALGEDATLFNEYHALIVQHAKAHCRVKPDCVACPLASVCDYRNNTRA
jgi:endonuclease-3 related protein